VEEADLAEHRPDRRHLEEHPFQRLVAPGRIGRHEFAGLVGEVDEDRAGFEQADRLPVRSIGIDDGGDLAVGVERQEGRLRVLVLADVDAVRLVVEAEFLQRDRDLDAVRRRQRIELDDVRPLGRPARDDRERRKIGHRGSWRETTAPT